MRHKLTDESWQQWRDENPEEVEKMKSALKAQGTPEGSSPNNGSRGAASAYPASTGCAPRPVSDASESSR
jgi:hypothetical protein